MIIRALGFHSRLRGEAPIRTLIDLGRFCSHQRAEPEQLPMIYLVEAEQLPLFRDLHCIVDRGMKNKHKGLSTYLLGLRPELIPLIDGNYGSSKQLSRSIRSLLAKASGRQDEKPYIVGARAAIFEHLWEAAREKDAETYSPGRAMRVGAPGSGEMREGPLPTDMFSQVSHAPTNRHVGMSMEAQLVRRLVIHASRSDDPVLILGEPGTGKEVIARMIHAMSPRAGHVFLAVNCGGLQGEDAEAELFGREAGHRFSSRAGLWTMAADGTIFLDGIGDLCPRIQKMILQVFQRGRIRPVGSSEEIEVHPHVIAAHHQELWPMVRAGTFDGALFDFVRTVLIRAPALRDDPSDIDLLAEFFWKQMFGEQGAVLTQSTLEALKEHYWPGNGRELRTVLAHLGMFYPGRDPLPEHLDLVCEYLGVPRGTAKGLESEKGGERFPGHWLRHLIRASEIVESIETDVAPVMKTSISDEDVLEAATASLSRRVLELDLLCRRPLWFPGDHVFILIHAFLGKLKYFLGLAEVSFDKSRNYWKEDVEALITQATSMLQEEIDHVLGEP